jgi:hypothetical protein
MRNVERHKVLRYHVRGRIELVVQDRLRIVAAVAAKLPGLSDPNRFARYMCSIGMTRAMTPNNVVVSDSVPFHDKVITAVRLLSESAASVRDLSISQDQRVGNWLLVVCTVPRKDVVVSSVPIRNLVAEAEFGVAKTLLESGIDGQKLVRLLRLAAKDEALKANIIVLEDLITWSGSTVKHVPLATVIPKMSDLDTAIIAGGFLSAKHKWTLAADAFSRCLELKHNNAFCQSGLREADTQKQKLERSCVASLFSRTQKRVGLCR